MNKITIAIDGFSSTGKSTIAKQLAKILAYSYVDSGAMYRAVTLYAMHHNYISESEFKPELLINDLNKINLKFIFNESVGYGEMYLNGKNVEHEIRTLEVSKLVSKVAEISEVRKKLVEQQQLMGKDKGVIMDGRDIGTVVFPNAELKLFMNASAEKRAIRRYNELIKRGDSVSFEEILKNVEYRDHIDSTREDSPLIKATNAIEIDNSNLTLEEQFDKIYLIVQEKLKSL
ncbi:(d)CMP kinase [Lutibacter sp. A64]|uniref:(d)CMP kinase n=1 Tax=Lutibacter sp. A64 TaxID=2918526 RepID=UPI001F06C488|nr:(d)CMP kinase [Lutibacter sp. A64]UMB54410.1 (d)CMP kinase [Lutibacter sp. A64]